MLTDPSSARARSPAPSPGPRPRADGRRRREVVTVLVVGLLVAILLGSVIAGAPGRAPAAAGAYGPTQAARALTSDAVRGTPSPSSTAAPPCYSLNATVCISMVNSSVPDIIPPAGSHVSTVEPLSSSTISLYVKSEYSLTWSTAKFSGPFSPLSLNATGVLWNGDPFYNASSDQVWHPTGSVWWSTGPTGTNTTYPYWYGLNFTPKSSLGTPNFFPGMNLTWWVYFVTNNSDVFHHWSSVPFEFTFAGAWPYSPYPGSPHYGGPGAAAQDLAVSQNPLAPNFNDSVNVTIATTSADLIPGATLGGAYLSLSEVAPDGATLATSTLTFPIQTSGTEGQVQSEVEVSTAFSHTPGALVRYTVTAWDTNTYGPDQIETQTYNYTVNGNGTFSSTNFADELALTTTPVGPGLGGTPPASVAAGQAVRLLVSSKNLGTAIFAAEATYVFNSTAINDTASGTIALTRFNSTNFGGSLPPMPLGASVTFEIVAWDFAQDRLVSPVYSFATPTLAAFSPSIPSNSTFFLVYVYDNGTHGWVTGANVQVDSVSGFVHTYATSFDGIAYPNATGQAFVPLLLPAGEAYHVTVEDPSFLPTSGSAGVMEVTLTAPHDMTEAGTLEVGSDYVVAVAGSSIFFWLNQTGPGATYAPPTSLTGTATIAGIVGLGALALTAVPLIAWWARIRAKRLAQEKRITL
jgi:hypothetical protein